MDFGYWSQRGSGLDSPLLCVDLDAFEKNISYAEQMARNAPRPLSLRLATKSLRIPELVLRTLSRGNPWQGLMLFSAREAPFWWSRGVRDLFVAYPTVSPGDVQAMEELWAMGGNCGLMIDSSDHLNFWEGKAPRGLKIPVWIDIDMSTRWMGQHIGVRRSPLRTVQQVVELAERVQSSGTCRLEGLMGYDAQVAGLQDNNPFTRVMNPLFRHLRKKAHREILSFREDISRAFKNKGLEIPRFNGGGSGSLNLSLECLHLTEVAVGSGLLCSHLFSCYSNIKWQPALWMGLEVCRTSPGGWATLKGGGYTASGPVGPDKAPVVVWPPHAHLDSSAGLGEVQSPLWVPEGVDLPLGHMAFFQPAKSGEIGERFAQAWLVRGQQVEGAVPTLRGIGLTLM